MSASRQLTAIGFFMAAAALLVKAAEIAMNPAHYAALCAFGHDVIRNVVVQAVLITVGFGLLVSLLVLAWDKAVRRHARYEEERAAARRVREEMARDAMTDRT